MQRELALPRTYRISLACALALTLSAAVEGCRRTPPRIDSDAVGRCEAAIDSALAQTTIADRDRIYYEGCADVYVEAACRTAFRGAAVVPEEQRLLAIAEPCRKAYCPLLDERGELEACGARFEASRANLDRAWPSLHAAILKYDARAYAPRLTRAMLGYYTRALGWPKPAPSASGVAPAGAPSALAPSAAASGATAAPAPSASGVPAPSASAAR